MEFQFDSLSAFFWMVTNGKAHGPYVWGAYFITFAGIIGIAMNLRLARKRFFKHQAAILKRNLHNQHVHKE